MKLLPSQDAIDAANTLESILRRHAEDGPSDRFFARSPAPLWSELADGGWLALGVAEDAGGAGFDLVDLAHVAEMWGRSLAPAPFIPTVLIWRWTGGAAAELGSVPLTFSLRRAAPASREKATIAPFWPSPTTRCVAALHPLALIDGGSGAAADAWAPSLITGAPPAVTDGLPPEAGRELAVLAGAELIGCGRKALERSVAYARERVQFDRPIAEFQAVQHLLADMHLHVETGRTAVSLAANESDRALHAASFVWERMRRTVEISVQVHGGFGFTWEAGLHFYQRHVGAWREILDACGAP